MVYIEFYPQVHLLLRNSRTLWIWIFLIIIIHAGCYGCFTVLFPICNKRLLSYDRLASNLASYSLCKVSWVYTQLNLPIDRFADHLPCFLPMHIGYTACTIREQFGNRYAITVWWFWNKIDVIDAFFPLFPYLLIYRAEEVAGSNPARSTELPPGMGYFALSCQYSAAYTSLLSTCHFYPTMLQLGC